MGECKELLLLVLAHLVASVGRPSLTNGCVGMYVGTMRSLVISVCMRWHGFSVVDGGRVVDGGCSQKEVMWQHVTHSYHIWDATDSGPHPWGYISLCFKASMAQFARVLIFVEVA